MKNLKRLHSYWQEKGGAKKLPARKDLDPIDFHYALGDVSLVQVDLSQDPKNPRYTVRLLGSNIQDRVGSALTNRDLDEFPETDSLYMMRMAYREVLKSKEPLAYPSHFKEGDKRRPFICCIWPLSSNGEEVDMLLCCREQLDEEAKIADQSTSANGVQTWPYQDWTKIDFFSEFDA